MADAKEDQNNENTIRIKVLFFAVARELAGTNETEITLAAPDSDPVTTTQLRDAVAAQFPKLQETVGNITLAVNQEYLEFGVEANLKDGDEVALIPPISGG